MTYYQTHRDKILEYGKQNYLLNKEKCRIYNAEYYKQHKDAIRESRKLRTPPKVDKEMKAKYAKIYYERHRKEMKKRLTTQRTRIRKLKYSNRYIIPYELNENGEISVRLD